MANLVVRVKISMSAAASTPMCLAMTAAAARSVMARNGESAHSRAGLRQRWRWWLVRSQVSP